MKGPTKREIRKIVQGLRPDRPEDANAKNDGKSFGRVASKKTSMRIRKQGI